MTAPALVALAHGSRDRRSAQTITANGGIAATTFVMNQAGQSVVFVPDGVGWFAFPGT